ncbi:MAG: hypothetical protein LUD47_00670 [Clostridia bacterium]|nr:hypothetical protein [Clostridia bacterium]
MKGAYLWKHTIRSVRRSPWQTVIIIVTVFLSALLFALSADLSFFAEEEYDLTAMAAYGSADIYISHEGSGVSYLFSEDVSTLCEEGDAYTGYLSVPARGSGWSALGAAADFETLEGVFSFSFDTGTEISEVPENAVFLAEGFAKELGITSGDVFTAETEGVKLSFIVAGVSPSYFFSGYDFFFSSAYAVKYLSSVFPEFTLSRGVPYEKAFIRLKENSDAESALEEIQKALKVTDFRAVSVSTELSDDFTAATIDVVVAVTMILAVIVAATVMYFSLGILSSGRERETETFLSAGMPPRRLALSLCLETAAYLVIGTAPAILASYFLVPAILKPRTVYVTPHMTGRGVLFAVIFELVSGAVSLMVHFARSRVKTGEAKKGSLVALITGLAAVAALGLAMVFTPVRLRYILALLMIFAVIAVIFALAGPVCRALGKASPAIRGRTPKVPCLVTALSGCGKVMSLRSIMRVSAVIVSVIAVLFAMYSFEAERVETEFLCADADYFLVNAGSDAVDAANSLDGAEACAFYMTYAVAPDGRRLWLVSAEDSSFLATDVGEVSEGDVFLPKTVADLLELSPGGEVTLTLDGEDITFMLAGYSGESVSYGYFSAYGAGKEYDMALVRCDSPGEEFKKILSDAVSPFGAVAETYERIFASAMSEAENFSEILAVYTWLIGIIAVTGTVDVAVVTYLKRRGEFKTMRLCGMSKRDIAKVVAEELAIIVVIAGAASALCGWGFTRLLDVALRSFGFALH